MFESEVEWIDSVVEDQARLKAAIWNDDEFRDYVTEFGVVETLRDVSDFHSNLAFQASVWKAARPGDEHWNGKLIGLIVQARSRRQALRRVVKENYGPDVAQEIYEEFYGSGAA